MKLQKLPYQALPDRFRGNVKAVLNRVLQPAGLEIGTTLEKRIEDERLRKLQASGHWEEQKYTQGLALDDEKALQFLNETCGPYQSEYRTFATTPNGDESQYFLENGWFGTVDAEILYSVLRRFQPTNIVEVGSGFSTRVMRRAINDGKLATRITSIDPHPNTSVAPYADEYIEAPVEDVEVGQIVNLLNTGDVLFIDSSHTVATGGDVPYLFLEVLPRLQAGVLIHIHDIFIPFDYPAEWVTDGWGWNEQYLAQAFLACNQSFDILWPSRYMWEYHHEAIIELIPSASVVGRCPSSFWLKRLN
ncbi:MAG: class I SAM-dependent methyltransferase [Pyrinomonadaceae bacterium]